MATNNNDYQVWFFLQESKKVEYSDVHHKDITQIQVIRGYVNEVQLASVSSNKPINELPLEEMGLL